MTTPTPIFSLVDSAYLVMLINTFYIKQWNINNMTKGNF